MKLHQKSVADLREEAYAEMASLEKYEPSEHEKSQGRWAAVVEKLLSDGEPDFESTCHVIPTFGAIHYISDRCWCGPRIDEQGTVIHEASQ